MKAKSVLNTDSFDRRRYKEIFGMSSHMQTLSETGKRQAPTFPELLSDVWASLYKMKPEIKEEVAKGLEINQTLMENIMKDESFQNFREVTRLDDLSSALGTVKFGQKTSEWLAEQEQRNKALQKEMEEARKQQREYEQQQQMETHGGGDKKTKQQTQQKLQKALQKAAQELQDSGSGFGQAMAEAVQETEEAKKNLKSLLSGTKAGSGDAELRKMPLRDQLTLAEKIASDRKMKEIAEWAGRFKAIARRKQRSKSKESIEKSGVTLGRQIERLLPMELAQYASPKTKTDFLRRFAEGQTMQYEQKGKETLGKGPIILCLDQSSSMSDLDAQSKGFALALMSIAKRQKRDFALIPFSKQAQIFTYRKGKISPHEMAELAQQFRGGGTEFDRPLEYSLKLIGESRFKKADVIFVTDGEAYLKESIIQEVNKRKKEKEFRILSILLGEEKSDVVHRFSDQIVSAHDFTDETSQTAFAI